MHKLDIGKELLESLNWRPDNKLTAYHSLPANLMIYQSSGHTFNGSDHAVVVAVYNGPGSTVSFHDDAAIQGSMMAKSIALAGTGSLYYDESLGTGSQTIGLGH